MPTTNPSIADIPPADADTSDTASDTTSATGAPERTARPARSAARTWWRRRPINRFLVVSHRWVGLILGLFLIVECTSGAILLYHSEIFRASNSNLYHHGSGTAVGPEQAMQEVTSAHPDFAAAWVARDNGVYVVGDPTYSTLWFVDPSNGHINGSGSTDKGFMGLMVNLHDCAFSCVGYPAYSSWFETEIWHGGPTFLTGITRGGFILGVLGLVAIALVLTSFKIWWPGWKRLKSRFVVRRGKGRFARDFDLHNVVGAIGLPFLLLWGVTGAAFEFPVVEKAWLAITAGHTADETDFSITPNPATAKNPIISLDLAQSAALSEVPGSISFIGMPSDDVPYYEFDIVSGYGSYRYRAIYSGDAYVLIDARDVTNLKVIEDGDGPTSNRLYDKVFEPSHFGWNVNPWWRILWVVFGLAPLLLFITGISTWLFRYSSKRRRKRARLARASGSGTS